MIRFYPLIIPEKFQLREAAFKKSVRLVP